MVSAVRRYLWFLFIKSQQYSLVSATCRYQRNFFRSRVSGPVVRRAADTGQYQGNVFRDLHLYRRMQVLCWRIQTCPPFVCFLFQRIGVCYRRLASVRTSSLLRFRIPVLRLLNRSCFPFTPIRTDSFDRKKMS